jgi:lysophospholipase L1-like esterase
LKKSWPVVGLILLAVLAVVVAGFAIVRPLSTAPASRTVATYTPPKAVLTPAPDVPRAAFIGDSYSAGTGSGDPLLRWTYLMSQKMGWLEDNFALAGTGYVNVGKPETCGKPSCPNYAGVVSDVVQANPDFIVISGGRNDVWYTPEEVKARVTALVSQLHAELPKAKIVITSPLWDDRPVPAEMESVIATVQEAAKASGIPYAGLGAPLAGKPDLIFTDGVHPDVAGHAAISDAAVKAVKVALKL